MKSLSLFTSAALLLSATSAFAITCDTMPSCNSLGYTNKVKECPTLADGSKAYIVCPFEHDKGTEAAAKCMYEAAVGQIAYFNKAPNATSGWVLCDGRTITQAKYPDLYTHLTNRFCTDIHGGKCGDGVARVPDYRGYFLRVYGTPNSSYSKVGNTTLGNPQEEGLPNITGSFLGDDTQVGRKEFNKTNYGPIGAFSRGTDVKFDLDSAGSGEGGWINFSAASSNSIYGKTYTTSKYQGVVPVNYAVYAYIYAGRVMQ